MESYERGSIPTRTSDYRSILALHKLTDQFTFGSVNIHPLRFKKWLRRLQNDGYQFCTLSEQLHSKDVNHKNIAFVYDDGYAHLARTLPSLMSEFDFSPAIALPTFFIDSFNKWDYSSLFRQERHLSKSEIVQLSEAGVEFISHGHSHVALTRCSERKLIAELIRSKEILEDIIGKPVTTVSYPFGMCNKRVIDKALAVGYTHGLTMQHPMSTDSSMQIGRYGIHCFDSYHSLISYLERTDGYTFYRTVSRLTSFLSRGNNLLQRIRGEDTGLN